MIFFILIDFRMIWIPRNYPIIHPKIFKTTPLTGENNLFSHILKNRPLKIKGLQPFRAHSCL